MEYLILIMFVGLPISPIFLRGSNNLWLMHGVWLQGCIAAMFCASLFLKPNKVKVSNLPFALFIFWAMLQSLMIFKEGIASSKYITIQLMPLMNIICMAVFYKVCVEYLNAKKISVILNWLSYILMVSLLYCVIQYFRLDQFLFKIQSQNLNDYGYPAVVGFIGNPTHLSAYLGMILPLLFLRERGEKWWSIVLLLIIISFCTKFGSYVGAVPITGIIVAIITSLYCIYHFRRKYFFIVAGLLILGVAAYVAYINDETRKALLSMQGRNDVWSYYFNMAKSTFITGKGLNAVNIINAETPFKGVTHLHNEYLHSLYEMGLLSMLSVVYCVWDFFKIKVKETRQSVVIRACIFGAVVQSLVLSPMHVWIESIVIIFLYSCLYAIKNEELCHGNKDIS